MREGEGGDINSKEKPKSTATKKQIITRNKREGKKREKATKEAEREQDRRTSRTERTTRGEFHSVIIFIHNKGREINKIHGE